MIIHMFLVYKIGFAGVYDRNKILKIVLCIGLYTAAVHFLYGNTILRYIILAIYGGMIVYLFFTHKETLLKIISKRNYDLR